MEGLEEIGDTYDITVNCTEFCSRQLVNDLEVYSQGSMDQFVEETEDGVLTYCKVQLGGTADVGHWFTEVDPFQCS